MAEGSPHEAEDMDFWQEMANGLESLNEIPEPDKQNDVIGHFFDGTRIGLNDVYTRIAKSGTLDQKGLLQALQHIGFLCSETASNESLLANKSLERLCSKKQQVSFQEFLRLVRCLRIGCVSGWTRRSSAGSPHQAFEAGQVYSFEFNNEYLREGDSQRERGVSGRRLCSQKTLEQFEAQPPLALVDLEKLLLTDATMEILEDFKSHNKPTRWVHVHRPDLPLLLAIGQRYQIDPHFQNVLCHLREVRPQVEIHPSQDSLETAESTTVSDDADEVRYQWNKIILPVLLLDETSRKTLLEYRDWQARGRKKQATPEPELQVRVLFLNMAVLWSSGGKKGGQSALTVASSCTYLGKWTASTIVRPTFFGKLRSRIELVWQKLFSGRKPDGYQYEQVSQDPEKAWEEAGADDDASDCEDDLMTTLITKKDCGDSEHCSKFNFIMRHTLRLLQEQNSRLRWGNHHQLMSRIVLSRVVEYLDVAELYKIAVGRLRNHLEDQEQDGKEAIIQKVSKAKLELNTIIGLLQPVVECILPQLKTCFKKDVHSSDVVAKRIPRHHVEEMEQTLHQCMYEYKWQVEQCSSIIDEYDRRNQDKTNNILNILTIITFLVMPVQIFTGLYGMNFKRMPELEWHHGYQYFFALSIIGTVTFAMMLICIFRVAT